MQTHRAPRWLILPLVMLALAACATPGTQGSRDTSIDLGGRWNDTAARVTAEAMVKEALNQPWPQRFTRLMGHPPAVSVEAVLDRTGEQLNTQAFVKELERALANSGQVRFVAAAGQRQETRQEGGADFVLQGVITTQVDERDGTKAAFYQVQLELVDPTSDVKVWQGQKRIKKP